MPENLVCTCIFKASVAKFCNL